MRRAIVVDAGCDLSETDRKLLGIEVWPIEIVYPARTEVDTRDEKALKLMYSAKTTDRLLEASTRPMQMGSARAKLMEFATRQDELLYIAIMTTRSPAMLHAKQAAESLPLSLRTERKVRGLPNFRFATSDSHQLFAGYAWVGAFAALRLAEYKTKADAFAHALVDVENASKNLSGYLIPGELKTIRERAMRKGEKSVGFFGYALGTALDIKPVIACRGGITGAVARVRGFDNAIHELVSAIIRQIDQGLVIHPLITIVYGGELSALNRLAIINQLDAVCRSHSIKLLRSMMSVTGLVNVGAGGFSIAVCTREVPYGDFNLLQK
jgi:fatty acid-binding protein DegV